MSEKALFEFAGLEGGGIVALRWSRPAAEVAVVEIEELQTLIADGQERGFVASDALATALEEARSH